MFISQELQINIKLSTAENDSVELMLKEVDEVWKHWQVCLKIYLLEISTFSPSKLKCLPFLRAP